MGTRPGPTPPVSPVLPRAVRVSGLLFLPCFPPFNSSPSLSSLFIPILPSLPPNELLLILQNPLQSVPPLGGWPAPLSRAGSSLPWAFHLPYGTAPIALGFPQAWSFGAEILSYPSLNMKHPTQGLSSQRWALRVWSMAKCHRASGLLKRIGPVLHLNPCAGFIKAFPVP